MGWTWTCFGGRKERLRRLDSDGRVRHRNRLCVLVRQERLDTDTHTITPPNPHSLGAQIRPKSPARDSSVYDEPFQPKQVVCGSLQGSKLFRRKPVRRANSFGSSSFENGAKKSCDKKGAAKTSGETQPEVLVDRLQEEVEALRKRLAEEEAEARKLRNEVCYLRSCGVLQSPERTSCSSIEKDSPSPGSFKDDRAQRHWQSWLGLTLSPASRLKLEDQLRLMAAEEMSKNPGKGLTNGQKALIVASRLWQYQDDPLHASQVKFEHRDSYSSDTSSCFGNNLSQNQSLDDLLPEKDVLPEGSRSRQLSKEAPLPECEEESTLHVASFRDSLDLKFPPGSSIIQEIKSKNPPSTSYESENFSFHPSSEKPVIKDVTVIQRATSFPSASSLSAYKEQQPDAEFEKCPPEEQVKFESPKRSCSLPNTGVAVPTSDEARRFIDLRYQELEEKLSRSPKRLSLSSPTATPDRSPPHPLGNTLDLEDLDSLPDALHASSPDAKRFPLNKTLTDSSDSNSDEDSPASPSTPVMSKPFYSARSGRVWQPLSPVKEVDSGLSSVPSSDKDASSVFSSQKGPSDSAEDLGMDSWTSESKSSLRSPLTGSEQDGHDDASSSPGSNSEAGDVHDDDLFTLSPRRLHRNYDPWEDARNFQADNNEHAKTDSSTESATSTDWTTSEDSDFNMLPIQCQSPDLSPKPLRSKFAKESEVKMEYPRDKYFKEMGLKVDEMLVSSDSTLSTETLGGQKENKMLSESFPAPGVDHPLHENSSPPKVSSTNDLTISQDCAHPILVSIENLPKWIEYQGVYVGPPVNKEATQVAAQALKKKEDVIQAQRDTVHGNKDARERATSVRTFPEMQRNDIVYARAQQDNEPELDTHQVQVEKGKPFYFEISQEKELIVHDTDDSPLGHQVVNHHRYSPATEGQVDEEVGGRSYANGAMDAILMHTRQNEVECLSPDSAGMDLGKPQVDAHSSTKQAREMESSSFTGSLEDDERYSKTQAGEFGAMHVREVAQKFDFRQTSAVSQDGLIANGLKTQHVEGSEESHHGRDMAKLTAGHFVSDGSGEEAESLRESCSSNQLLVQYPCVSNDSGVVSSSSRATDQTGYSCDSSTISSPTLLQRRRQSSFSTLVEASDQAVEDEANNSDSGGSEKDLYPVYPARGMLTISPDDRPILGTVATWWGDESLSKSRRWWDGQGIPNSTSKYKEDQRVNWHTTPFETRLEQALATQTTVPTEPCDQRDLFDEGVVPVIESADMDVLKPAAPRSEAILI
ncbi:hypothetical protein MPTK1_5g12590 [Marchantia polymorpha subsp. ruderalis]|uniref:Uncharacterized protein n=2 Tax=Marchantia polymorpha TaxID=3197 RepID=A0AAF6BHN0_MARPO|nr:hypothetical protein MARPO_0092s0048 [Marchantia polymorpha]BBN11514.1 hypothetical protein Mp_5g12590 [Marchantia polymorpha subsp. ruderalis]|eukprot:PTQ33087.1 hypothetical protein MARPO_0092s0048 [Marchantia polymorpha]